MTRKIKAVDGAKTTVTVDGGLADIVAGADLTVRLGTDVETHPIDHVTAPDQIVLTAALTKDYTGGTAEAGFKVQVLVATANVTAQAPDKTTVTVDDATGFAPGDQIHVDGGGNNEDVRVSDVSGNVLSVDPALTHDYTGGGGTVRTADLKQNATVLRLRLPSTLSTSAAFPPGSLVKIDNDFARVTSSGGDTIQLDPSGLPNNVALADQAGAPEVQTADFDLTITPPDSTIKPEKFTFLSMDVRSPGYWNSVASNFVTLAPADPMGTAAANDDRPKAETKSTGGGAADNTAGSWADLANKTADYLAPLAKLHDVSLLAIPGATDPGLQQAMIDHCESLQDRFAILDCGANLDITGVANQFASVRSAKGYAALYYPRILVKDPITSRQVTWPTSGHMAGVYARTDEDRGVHKAPANTNLRGALGLEPTGVLSDHEQGPLNLMGVNVLRVFPGQAQPIVWGARTTAGDLDRNWQYVNIRRLFIYLEQSIERGIRWAVFEPNDTALWHKLKRTITDFLMMAWRDGALFGDKPEQAFYVRIDETLNPESTRKLGRLYIEVGLCPTYPAEFIVLRIGIWDGGSESSTS